MGLVALLMLIGLTISDISYFRPESKLRNFEGRLARLLLFVPLGILLGRNIAIYDVTPILCGSILAGIGSLLFWGLPSYVENKSLIRFTQGLSAIPFSGAWFYIAIALFFSGHNGAYLNLAETAFLPVMFFPISGLFIALSFMSEGLGRGFRALGSGVAI
ncbi:MAG: hypothetical protein KDD53_13175, partial [Bdellovibrionales bacterium]|nr:hypothetical protein [Bdellovibrionales bacterium]